MQPGTDGGFVKNDGGKLRYSLIPLDALKETVKVLEFGAARYSPDNWCRGADWSRYYNAAMRHLTAFWMREDNDPESGISHLAHVLCCGLFLLAYQLREIGNDDRPVLPRPAENDKLSRQ